jgi:pimeloyl-ACP methyl ester carboxylesterase
MARISRCLDVRPVASEIGGKAIDGRLKAGEGGEVRVVEGRALEPIVGANDRAVPPAQSATVRDMAPGATLAALPDLGHLAHEEDPAASAALILQFARDTGVLP